MASATTITSGSLSVANWTTASTGSCIAATSEAVFYPKSNLTSAYRSKRWRSIGTGQQDLDFDLGSALLPTVIALVDSNLAASKTLTILASDSSGFGSGETYTYTSWTYTQGAAGVLLLYRSAPDSGSATARRYWRIRLPASGTSSTYHELGVVWLGTYLDAAFEYGAGNKINDRSKSADAYNGAMYYDTFRTTREIDISVPLVSETTVHTMERAIEVAGGSTFVLLDLFGSTTTTTKKASSSFYGTLDLRGGASLSYKHALTADWRFSFAEAVA